jgi:hypothetical protein
MHHINLDLGTKPEVSRYQDQQRAGGNMSKWPEQQATLLLTWPLQMLFRCMDLGLLVTLAA